MAQKYLYIVFSSTPNKMGRMIRSFTGCPYNHVSLALEESLCFMFSFARRYYRTPFYGGFVKESIDRYHIRGKTAAIRVCRLPVSEAQHKALDAHLTDMLERQDQYLYNHLSAFALPFRRRVNIRDAYICVDFVAELLRSAGIALDPQENYSVGQLEQLLRPYLFYTGPAPDARIHDTTYFAPRPIPHPVIATALAFGELVSRLFE